VQQLGRTELTAYISDVSLFAKDIFNHGENGIGIRDQVSASELIPY
jgi:hypothetical protein